MRSAKDKKRGREKTEGIKKRMDVGKIIGGKRKNIGKYVRKRKKKKIDEGSKADKNTEAGVGDIN